MQIRQHHADGVGATTAEAACRMVRRVLQSLRRGLGQAPHVFGHVAIAVQCSDTVATDTAASRATSLMLLVIAVSNSPGGTLAMECKRVHDDFKTRPTRSTQNCANFLYNPLIYI